MIKCCIVQSMILSHLVWLCDNISHYFVSYHIFSILFKLTVFLLLLPVSSHVPVHVDTRICVLTHVNTNTPIPTRTHRHQHVSIRTENLYMQKMPCRQYWITTPPTFATVLLLPLPLPLLLTTAISYIYLPMLLFDAGNHWIAARSGISATHWKLLEPCYLDIGCVSASRGIREGTYVRMYVRKDVRTYVCYLFHCLRSLSRT